MRPKETRAFPAQFVSDRNSGVLVNFREKKQTAPFNVNFNTPSPSLPNINNYGTHYIIVK